MVDDIQSWSWYFFIFFLSHGFIVDRVDAPSAPKYGHWVERNNNADSLPGYDAIGSRNSRSGLPNYEEAIAMSYISTSLHI